MFTGSAVLPLFSGLAEAARYTSTVTRAQADGRIAGQRARTEADRLFQALSMFVVAVNAPMSGGDRG
ncbi:hypothetical protein [Streptomyces sp. uw30]|uniref:hypothetical protein n=1 Tax=Streptomyces sp. uw30 TaxID=1828179 RepID=UPI001C9C3532|nr:hypothetical protein [Streptomyces sp. uw30]